MKCEVCGAAATATVILGYEDGDARTAHVCGDCLRVAPVVAALMNAEVLGVYQPAREEGTDATGPAHRPS